MMQATLLFSHYEVKALWRNRATEFTVHEVYDATKKNPMVILLVGTLPKDLLR
jgi:hypothetical protein